MIDIQLKKILKLKRLSQINLAEISGISRQTVISLLQGGDTKISTLRILSEKLNVPITYWFEVKTKLPDQEDQIQKNADIVFLQDQLIIEKERVLEYLGTIEKLKTELLKCNQELTKFKSIKQNQTR